MLSFSSRIHVAATTLVNPMSYFLCLENLLQRMRLLRLAGFALLVVGGLVLTGCGASGTSSAKSNVLSGNWQMTLTRNPTFARTQSGFLIQSGATLAGGLTLSSNLLGNCAAAGPAQGNMSGSTVAITVNETGQTVNLTGTAASDGSSVTGNYSIYANGCGLSEVGTWAATKVKTLTGNIQATFTSSAQSNLVYQFSGSIAQGPNTGTSTANLTGNMTSSNAPCVSTASISGLISGTSVLLNPFASDGTALGQVQATMTTDASTITGVYDFKNVNSNVFANCGGGDYGNVTISVQ